MLTIVENNFKEPVATQGQIFIGRARGLVSVFDALQILVGGAHPIAFICSSEIDTLVVLLFVRIKYCIPLIIVAFTN